MDAVDLLNRAMIADWRDSERLRIDHEMQALAKRLVARFSEEVALLTWKDLVSPKGQKRLDLKRRLEAEINRAYTRELRRIDQSLEVSMRLVTGSESVERVQLDAQAALLAGGALAVSSVVIAASAATLATTATTSALFFTTATFSWPVFLGVGAGAVVTAFASPGLLAKALDRMRDRVRLEIENQVATQLIGETAVVSKSAVRTALLQVVETIYRTRIGEPAR